MRVGGNQSFFDFLKKYHLHEEQAEIKYHTKAAQFYRKQLLSLAGLSSAASEESKGEEEAPSYDEGRTLQDGSAVPTRSPQDAANRNDIIEEELKEVDVSL